MRGIPKEEQSLERAVRIAPTPEEVGRIFAAWTDEEQARFLLTVARAFDGWEPIARDMQMLTMGEHMHDDAKRFVGRLATFVTDERQGDAS